jgi:hypothetical protein
MAIFLSQSSHYSRFAARNVMFVPIQNPEPTRFYGLIMLSGVAMIDFAGNGPDWRHDQVILDLDVDFRDAIRRAPYQPPPSLRFVGFAIQQVVPFASVNARFAGLRSESHRPADDGTAVDTFFGNLGGPQITIDVGVKNRGSAIYRLGYQLSLYGPLLLGPAFTGTVEGEGATVAADEQARNSCSGN